VVGKYVITSGACQLVRLPHSVTHPDVDVLAEVPNSDDVSSGSWVLPNTSRTRLVVRVQFGVLSILLVRDRSEIGDPVVQSVAVKVIQLILGKLAMHVEPRESVR